MAIFSVAVTKTMWSIKDLETGKLLVGKRYDMPKDIIKQLEVVIQKNQKYFDYIRCFSSTIELPWEDPLTRWVKYMHQSVLTNGV